MRTVDASTGEVVPGPVASEAIVLAAQAVDDSHACISPSAKQQLIELSDKSLPRLLAAVDGVRAGLVTAL